jgi:hypothetical protein
VSEKRIEIQETKRGIEVRTSFYRLLLDRVGGFAIREVEIEGVGRLDRFDRPGEGPHPTCMYFDNCTIDYAFQLGYYGIANTGVVATIDGLKVRLEGSLIPIIESAKGRVSVVKEMSFHDDLYEVDLSLSFENTGPISYASAWWDVNDKWLRSMRSSAGVFLPLQVGIGDCFGDDLRLSWRSMPAMDRGAGVWMEMIGEKVSVLVSVRSAPPATRSAGGMKYWDGPDDADAGEGVSHGCINLDWINCELSGAGPVSISKLESSYQVFLSGSTELRS